MAYNLIEENWIPVLYLDGKFARVGIRKALEDAGRIRQIAASNPMDRLATLRFLLALLYWCRGNPTDEGNAISGGSLPPDWFLKLDGGSDCFNLLGDGSRFYQARDAQRTRPSTDLIQEIPTGNNFWHFRHSTDRIDGLCAPCCAMGLLRLPLFSVSGLPNLLAGINGVPPIYVVPWGASLLDTICANWKPGRQLGEPAWGNPDVRPVPGEEVSLLTGLTLLSRRVWLHDPSGPPGRCDACGVTSAALIRECEFQAAGKQENDRWDDPHVLYLHNAARKSLKAADATAAGKFRMGRPWPNLLASILAEAGKFAREGDMPTSLVIVGFATNNAKNIDVWERTVAVPSRESLAANAVPLLKQWDEEGRRLEKQITRPKKAGAVAIAAIRPHVEDIVYAKAGELFARGDEAWNEAAGEYAPMMTMLAKSLSPGFTTAAVQRRQQIAGIVPDMRRTTAARKGAGAKKGADK